ncbi:hypothetical protein JQ557_17185 [Bradyrhizobium sp. U87765 SZCCT0131]|uniref:hypothetical protein n=1 Tax=unclassified Bradyrhizobium TaxID=2631580 RepID=UPI001BA59824|nr:MULTISPECIES: hypothetical protein [unclassified Bradyrhizobium]MBR1219745.1 hypothetical protein [Bradyrhizobium sp. U87765 SZCCT0131]MBR1262396.1 hypothetical protein [Bradyrhizobium sp. U87765 SZCCT0134]MBR1308421.1 hypothetical protein [Bradyrhizobium sp. U87765 SZCCT0110]MBR1318178.1 hypothetical protein [Bradyrhizobium sp. U87765 SZCCT0109]MBR1351881.1 hypothetical protein [Bradyrhizobium sp. U87765 SZCCT0048]
MADVLSILRSSYANVQTPSRGKYVNVDATLYEGSWKGKYSTGEQFSFHISDVQGYRAKVKYQAGAEVKYQDVLIKDNGFRVGDTKFMLTRAGHAQIKSVVTNAATGASVLNTAYADKT